MSVRLFVVVLSACLVSGCAARRDVLGTRLAVDALEQRCQAASLVAVPVDRLYDAQVDTQGTENLKSVFSEAALHVAETVGLTEALVRFVRLRDHADGASMAARVGFLEARQQITDKLLLISFDIDGIVSEIDCEAERAGHLAAGLEEARDKRVRTLTLIAIIGDALVGILAGGLSLAGEEVGAAAAAITGGTIATGFGLGAVFTGRQHEFSHPRNLLREIWEGAEEPRMYPRPVWRFLSSSAAGDPLPRRAAIVTHWEREGFLGGDDANERRRLVSLLFEEGGTYEIEDLRTRQAMLLTIKAEINLMNQQLNLLLRELLKVSGNR